jgi:hypothetical protein
MGMGEGQELFTIAQSLFTIYPVSKRASIEKTIAPLQLPPILNMLRKHGYTWAGSYRQ